MNDADFYRRLHRRVQVQPRELARRSARVAQRPPQLPLARPDRTYGELKYKPATKSVSACWELTAEPHVVQVAKRLWKRAGRATSRIKLEATPSTAIDLAWLLIRYPVKMSDVDRELLNRSAREHEDRIRRVQDYLGQHLPPPKFELAIPPYDYQAREAAVILEQGFLLIADAVGLGKSASGITVMTNPDALPAIVVTLTHLPKQWAREIKKFAPWLRVHVIRNGPLYPLTGAIGEDGQRCLPGVAPDVIVTSYSKLAKWAPVLAAYARFVYFDEVQELRRGAHVPGGQIVQKNIAAAEIAERMKYRGGCSATPIYNYGDEMFNILEVLAPGKLGSRTEFYDEWCIPVGNQKYKIKEPEAFGSWAREQGLMVRHTRKEVGRELPDAIATYQEIGAEAAELDKVEGRASELARILMNGHKLERGEAMFAGGELEQILRQQTGLAKVPFSAEFVRLLVDSGEKVLMACWHHSVYDLLEERLKPIRCVRYTGKETASAKDRAFLEFRQKRNGADVMMISLRSGVGLEGLQEVCRVVVFAELDWSPGIMGVDGQVVGRLRRDGQADPVLVYYLVADSGSDPVIAEVLGVKQQQARGVLDPGSAEGPLFGGTDGDHVRRLAEAWLEQRGER